MNEENYNAWYCDNEKTLKEDFLMQYTHEQLRQMIIDAEEYDFWDVHEKEWKSFKDERYNNDMELD